MGIHDNDETQVVESMLKVGPAAWDVEYQGVPSFVVRYALRNRSVYHQLAESNHPNRIRDEANRARDFKGKVIFGRTFARWPGDADHRHSVSVGEAGLSRAVGLRSFVRLRAEGTLRRFLAKTFNVQF